MTENKKTWEDSERDRIQQGIHGLPILLPQKDWQKLVEALLALRRELNKAGMTSMKTKIMGFDITKGNT